ncbi:hypothetical protein LINPERPRIM_LOCUS39413 [Linum perenne]
MTGDNRLFTSLKLKLGGKVTFDDNKKGRILGQGSVGLAPNPVFNNVLLVQNLKHNLLSISQLCGTRNKVIFEPSCCKTDTESFVDKCFAAVDNSPQNIWHRKLGHISSSRISKLNASKLVRGLPQFSPMKDFF